MLKRTPFFLSVWLWLANTLAVAADVPEGNPAHDYALNLQPPKSAVAHAIFDMHTWMLIVCLVIFFVVFGVMFYSILKHRKSLGHKPATFHENHKLELVWTLIPFLIVIGMTIPAAYVVLQQKDARNPDLSIKVTGYQWKWGYEYLDDGTQLAGTQIAFLSNLSTPQDQINNLEEKGTHYLLEVDRELVVPVGKKVRLLVTANDVVHSWSIPQLGVKQDAIPGFIRATWFKAEEPGVYRGQCSELCGKDHGFMPIVVRVLPQADYEAWVAEQKGAKVADAVVADKVWSKADLMAKGATVYGSTCVACHQANGQGLPGAFPALAGSKIATGPKAGHMERVLNGKPGTAMSAFGSQLSDAETAAVITYERNSWGNNTGDVVQPSEVKAARK